MKKSITIIAIIILLLATVFTIKVAAADLGNFTVSTDKHTIHPKETIQVTVGFGEELGAYTVDIAYDNNLLEYVSAEGGTANDNGTRIRVFYYDETGGSKPRTSMSVSFKAKSDLLTSNPTNFSVTAEGLANADASVSYDDITTPIIKEVIAEPNYVDYAIDLTYTGDIGENIAKDMKIDITSSMGKNYDHTRIVANATTPTGGSVKLLGKDSANLEHDIIQTGWGDAAGNPIGGKDVVKELNVQGLFSKAGDYTITLTLIDRDNSDAEIASKTFTIPVKGKENVEPPKEEDEDNKEETPSPTPETPNDNNSNNDVKKPNDTTNTTKEPTKLPKAGTTNYITIISVMTILTISYVVLKSKKS